MGDPNWLLSTIAQSAAAIVAIVGGFLVSRVVGLAAERNSLLSRRAETQAQLSIARRELQAAEERLLRLDIDDFLDLAVRELVEEEAYPTLNEMLEKTEYTAAKPEALLAAYDELLSIVRATRDSIRTSWHKLESLPHSYNEFLEQTGHQADPRDERDLDRKLFDEVRTRSKNSPLSTLITASSFDPGIILSPEMRAVSAQAEIDRYRAVEELVEALRNQVARLAGQGELIEQLAVRGVPSRNIWWGFAVLLYLSLVGVLVPVLYLPQKDGQFSRGERELVISLFASGLLFVLIYLGVSIAVLRRIPRLQPLEPSSLKPDSASSKSSA